MPRPARIDLLLTRLGVGITSASDLGHALGISQPSVSRALRNLADDGRVLRIGSTRGARYALRREIEGVGSAWPLRRVDRNGDIHEIGNLHALAADQYYLESSSGALTEGFAWGGVSEGLPYFLQDQRPGGFLGRAVPLHYPELNLPQRVIDWSDEHYLRYLTQRGFDTIGDLILGRHAFDGYLSLVRHRTMIDSAERATRYPQLAEEVMQGGLPGSSAHGEHPKFAALLQEATGARQVLVKFSPPLGTPIGQRWSDLLIAEHLAHRALGAAEVAAATSQIFQFAGRTYLEVDRFDREGADGRIGVTSLFAIDTSLHGKLDNWIAAAGRLHDERRIDSQTLEQIRLISTFGALIANTDRHFGNLSFNDSYHGRFQLAPVYDMLPMLFAPEHDQIVARTFSPPDPTSDTLRAWARARTLAENYWRALSSDPRISTEFRTIGGACLLSLEALPRTGAYAYQEAGQTAPS